MASEEFVPTPAYLWFDTEFTDLDPNKARLLQVALLITDRNLNRLTPAEKDINLYIRLDPSAKVSSWVEENLPDLLARCRSDEAVELEEADRRLAELVDGVIGPIDEAITKRPVLAGNAVYVDRNMARMFLPRFVNRLHYRVLDVSALKIVWNDWMLGETFDKEKPEHIRGNLPDSVMLPAGSVHDAYYDIHASLAELNAYRKRFLE